MDKENQENHWCELAQKSQSGDKKAYNQLLSEIYPVIKKFLISKVGPGHNHEDMTQECLIAIHKALHTYDSSRKFKPWLFAVARYKLIDNLRKIQKQMAREVANPELLATIPDDASNTIESDDGELIEQALESLPQEMRRAIVLTKIEGLSTKEASEKEGISLGPKQERLEKEATLENSKQQRQEQKQRGKYLLR